eukprot:Selendium_serpulae@DN6473_c0_g1_i2.p2
MADNSHTYQHMLRGSDDYSDYAQSGDGGWLDIELTKLEGVPWVLQKMGSDYLKMGTCSEDSTDYCVRMFATDTSNPETHWEILKLFADSGDKLSCAAQTGIQW